MGKLAKRPLMTAERFLRRDRQGYEFVGGRIQEKVMGAEATWIQGDLLGRVREFVRPARLGLVFGADCMYQCFAHNPEQVRKPDFSFLRSGKLAGDFIPKGPLTVPPDWLAEVVSPNERVNELNARIEDFLAAKVPLIWVVYPEPRTVTVHTGRRSTTFIADEELTTDPVLPGFRVRVSDLFPPLPAPAS